MVKSDDPPIATATVARLYLEQGKIDQAEALYRRLLQEEPDDPRIAEGLAQVAHHREVRAATPTSGDRVTLERIDEALRCQWRVTDEGRHQARLVLGEEGALVLRIVPFPSGPRAPLDVPLDHAQGLISVPCPEGAVMVGASVGLAAGEHFVSITHCKPLDLGERPCSAEPSRR